MSYEWRQIIGWEAHLQGQWQPRKSHKETIKVTGGQRLGHVKDMIKSPLSPGENLHPDTDTINSVWRSQNAHSAGGKVEWLNLPPPPHLWERHLGRFLHNRTFCPPTYPDAPCKALSLHKRYSQQLLDWEVTKCLVAVLLPNVEIFYSALKRN